MVLWRAPTSSFAEAFRQIRANIDFATASQPARVLLVSSPGPSEGKSTIISNLSVAFAQTGKRVLVIDGDLRRPSLHRLFEIKSREPGVSNLLAHQGVSIDDVVRQTQVEGVSLIPSGPSPPNPAELLGSADMTQLLEDLKARYDLILVDSPPMLPVADGSIMASKVDGLVVVVDGFGTRSSALKATLDMVRSTQVNLIGVIINKLKRPRFGYGYGYHYYYYYRSYHRYYASEDGVPANGANGRLRGLAGRARKVFSVFRR
jgi:capsular exopolysaccharide synthesis family protein